MSTIECSSIACNFIVSTWSYHSLTLGFHNDGCSRGAESSKWLQNVLLWSEFWHFLSWCKRYFDISVPRFLPAYGSGCFRRHRHSPVVKKCDIKWRLFGSNRILGMKTIPLSWLSVTAELGRDKGGIQIALNLSCRSAAGETRLLNFFWVPADQINEVGGRKVQLGCDPGSHRVVPIFFSSPQF